MHCLNHKLCGNSGTAKAVHWFENISKERKMLKNHLFHLIRNYVLLCTPIIRSLTTRSSRVDELLVKLWRIPLPLSLSDGVEV